VRNKDVTRFEKIVFVMQKQGYEKDNAGDREGTGRDHPPARPTLLLIAGRVQAVPQIS
jgi:hypothetical protein